LNSTGVLYPICLSLKTITGLGIAGILLAGFPALASGSIDQVVPHIAAECYPIVGIIFVQAENVTVNGADVHFSIAQ
jgi:hypothetical protein